MSKKSNLLAIMFFVLGILVEICAVLIYVYEQSPILAPNKHIFDATIVGIVGTILIILAFLKVK